MVNSGSANTGAHNRRGLDASFVERFDAVGDAVFERLRGRRWVDSAMNTTTNAADHSLLWHALGVARAALLRRPEQAVALAVGLGVESLLVNQGIKRMFRRQRPTPAGDDRYQIREPSTSSFPSGHASSAFFAATVLTGWDGPSSWMLYGPLATVVALSRPYVRIHHTSDVVGGAVVGVAGGLAARMVLRRVGLMSDA